MAPLIMVSFAVFMAATPVPGFGTSVFQGFQFSGGHLTASVTLRFGKSETSLDRFYSAASDLLPFFILLDRCLASGPSTNRWYVSVDETTVEILGPGGRSAKEPRSDGDLASLRRLVCSTTAADPGAGPATNVLFALQVAFIPAAADTTAELRRWRRKLPRILDSAIAIRGDVFSTPLWMHTREDGSRGIRYGLFPDYASSVRTAEKLRLGAPNVQVVPVVWTAATVQEVLAGSRRP